MKQSTRLPRTFFTRPTLTVAPELLGKCLVSDSAEGRVVGEITEVEVYLGSDDAASHAFKGLTSRSKVMWLEGGHWYVYFIYGRHFCLNIVTEAKDKPAAILIRAVKPIEGVELMKQRRQVSANISEEKVTGGPAKVAQAFGISTKQNGSDSLTSTELWLEDRGVSIPHYQTTPRIGIKKNADKLWRFTAS